MVSPQAPTEPPPWPAHASPCTHHHQECRKPGGSPSVMFFSHRICREEGRQVRGHWPPNAAPPQAGNTGQGTNGPEPGGQEGTTE